MHVWQNAKFLFPGLSAACKMHIGWEICVPCCLGCVASGREQCAVTLHRWSQAPKQSSCAHPIPGNSPQPLLLIKSWGRRAPGGAGQAGFKSRRSVLRRGWMRWVTFHLHCCPWPFPGRGLRMMFRHIRCSKESFQHHGWFYLLCRGDASC